MESVFSMVQTTSKTQILHLFIPGEAVALELPTWRQQPQRGTKVLSPCARWEIHLGKFHHDLTTTSLEIMVSKGNHPQMAARFRLVKYYNLPRLMDPPTPFWGGHGVPICDAKGLDITLEFWVMGGWRMSHFLWEPTEWTHANQIL